MKRKTNNKLARLMTSNAVKSNRLAAVHEVHERMIDNKFSLPKISRCMGVSAGILIQDDLHATAHQVREAHKRVEDQMGKMIEDTMFTGTAVIHTGSLEDMATNVTYDDLIKMSEELDELPKPNTILVERGAVERLKGHPMESEVVESIRNGSVVIQGSCSGSLWGNVGKRPKYRGV